MPGSSVSSESASVKEFSRDMDLDDLEKQCKANRSLIDACFAYLAGHLDTWAYLLKENPETTDKIIEDMSALGKELRRVAGVKIVDNL